MKPTFQHLGFDCVNASFLCYRVASERFGFHWHYHPECEISYVVRGHGTRLVGDNVEEFQAGDLLFIGPDLPHTLISDELYNQSGLGMEVIVIQFRKEILEDRSLEIVELAGIGKLIAESGRGLHFPSNEVIGAKLRSLTTSTGFAQYHGLLDVLHDISLSERRPLASEFYNADLRGKSEERIGRVCRYIHEHYAESIKIAELASLAHMNEASFCRFFRKMTGKTAINYINDLRIGNACQLLHQEGIPISEVAFRSGYESITHFNRSFLKRKQVSPSVYRKSYASQN